MARSKARTTTKPPQGYDAGIKSLIRAAPKEWLAFLGFAVGVAPVEVLNADLASVNLAADGLLKIGGASPFGVHIECESGGTGSALPARLLTYNVLAERAAKGLLFQSVAVVMTKKAESPRLSGVLEKRFAGENAPYLTFRYRVIRLYQLPPEAFLSAGVSLVPLTLLGDVSESDAPRVAVQMGERIIAESESDAQVRELAAATYLLTGAKYKAEVADRILKGALKSMFDMEDSDTYRYIHEKASAEGISIGIAKGKAEGLTVGKAEGKRETLLRIGTKRFGIPTPQTVERIIGITDEKELDALLDRALEAESWDEFWER